MKAYIDDNGNYITPAGQQGSKAWCADVYPNTIREALNLPAVEIVKLLRTNGVPQDHWIGIFQNVIKTNPLPKKQQDIPLTPHQAVKIANSFGANWQAVVPEGVTPEPDEPDKWELWDRLGEDSFIVPESARTLQAFCEWAGPVVQKAIKNKVIFELRDKITSLL